MRLQSLSPLTHLPLVAVLLMSCIPQVCQAGRLPDNPIFAMEVNEDDVPLMNDDTQEQKLLKQFEEQQFEKFKEEQEKKDREEEEARLKEKEEEEERKRDEEAKRERERKKEEKRLQEEKEEREEHERRQNEIKEIERQRKEKEEEEQREHNKQWREKHEGRKKAESKQEEWQQKEAEEAELARKKFEESFDDETESKKKEEAEAAELRALEPHIEMHNKQQKEEMKELEANTAEVIDRLNPDDIIHEGEEKPAKEEKKEEEAEEKEEDEKEKAEREAAELKAKLAQEAEELAALEPHVEIHNKVEKKIEEMMKDKPFVAGDIEVAVHGADHVHEDKKDEEDESVGVKVVAELKDALKKDDEEKGEIGADDPEHMMHGGGDHEHGGKDKKDAPGLAMPGGERGDDPARDDSIPDRKKKKTDDKTEPGIGMDKIEEAIHGEFLAHDYTNDKKPGPGKVITKEDILKLGLSKELLKGVDLTKLLARDQRQYERFQNGEDEDDDDDEDSSSFWGQMSRIRKDYLDSLAARIRNIGVPDMETAEWDKHDLDDREMPTADKGALKPGESALEHEMESWGNSGGKGKEGNAKFAPKVGEIPE